MTNSKAIAIAAVWIGVGMCGIGAGIHGGDGTAFIGVAIAAFFGSVATKHIVDGESS